MRYGIDTGAPAQESLRDRMTIRSPWTFATRFYAAGDVARTLRMLQDRDGADVLMVLTLLHCAQRGRMLDAAAVARIDAAAVAYRAVIAPLRTARRAIPHDATTLLARVKAAELLAERRQLTHLARIAATESLAHHQAAAAPHLAHYLPDSPERASLLAAFARFGR
ncbi:hypothetical protein BH10PSE15_BH10PSE15_02800 [soil metagenome]